MQFSPHVQDNHPNTFEKPIPRYHQKQSEGLSIFVATKTNDEVIGFSNLNMFLTLEYDTTVHTSVSVAEGNRGLGVAKSLIEKFIEWSK